MAFNFMVLEPGGWPLVETADVSLNGMEPAAAEKILAMPGCPDLDDAWSEAWNKYTQNRRKNTDETMAKHAAANSTNYRWYTLDLEARDGYARVTFYVKPYLASKPPTP